MSWDVIVIGTGIGGLTAAAALARRGKRVLMLEQHVRPGGQTQTFRRGRWTFATGVHYIGGVADSPGPEGQFKRLLDWLAGEPLEFAPSANPYDIVRLPGFEFGIPHPEAAFREALVARFPDEAAAIHDWFADCEQARRGAMTAFQLHGMPRLLAAGLRLWRGREATRWATRTVAEALERFRDPRLRAVLGARWGDYGAPPARAPLAEHALVTGSYNDGAFYPVGGPARFAQAIVPTVRAAGGELRTGARVRRILVQDDHVCGVVYEHAGAPVEEHARHVVSAIGVANTMDCLGNGHAARWRETVEGLAPGIGYISLFLGLEGDIAAAGASSANQWVFESEDIGQVWTDPAGTDAPGLFVSFPSLKDPASPPDAPTAEVIAIVDPRPFARWLDDREAVTDDDYRALKATIETRMLAQFDRHFPALAPLRRFHELATPVTQRHYIGAAGGAMYGVEMSAERLTSPALHVKTPLPGLFLAGQDVTSPGIQGAAMGGLMAAAAIEPTLWRQFAG